jgi:geranylgeranyl diphosphate/geranylgeranyl-bacteriochlorophyllide a reductase
MCYYWSIVPHPACLCQTKVVPNCDVLHILLFCQCVTTADDKMKYYENLAEMYVGDDVSPDFYGWVFPKYDHVAVGTGTVVNKTAIKQYQQATRDRSKVKTAGGKIIRCVLII